LQGNLSATFDQSTLNSQLDLDFNLTAVAQLILSDRSKFVSVGGRRSKTMVCKFGVPQGSVLGPLLFSQYVSPIVNVISGFGISLSQYVDDTQLYISLKDERALSLSVV